MLPDASRPIVLLYPPPSDPTQPYSSLPALSAFLRGHGYSVVQKDLGLEILDMMLTPEYLKQSLTRSIERMSRVDQELSTEEALAYVEKYDGLLNISGAIVANIDKAKAVMKDERIFYDIKQYYWATNIIKSACDIVSLPFFPTSISPTNLESKHNLDLYGLFQAIQSESDNVYYNVLKSIIIPNIVKMTPLFVGISITYHFQLIPALTLSWLFKAIAPSTHICLGGAMIQRMESLITQNPQCFELANSFCVGEGETALTILSQRLSRNEPINCIPNLITESPCKSDLRWHENVPALPCPDYNGLDLSSYLSPEPVVLLPLTRGCYYQKCAFCDVAMNTRSCYRPVSSDIVCRNMTQLYMEHGIKRFFFADNAVAPKQLLEIAAFVEQNLPDATWQAEVRLEKQMNRKFLTQLKKGGCRQLCFGLESASQRVLDLMNKNNRLDDDYAIIEACFHSGIAVNLQTMVGFPTETREEALSTINFLITNETMISSIGFSIFALYTNTPIYNNPTKYLLSNVYIENSLTGACSYVPSVGMSRKEAKELRDTALSQELAPLYRRRSTFLAGALGAHSLLQFSYFEYQYLMDLWKEIESEFAQLDFNSTKPVFCQTAIYPDIDNIDQSTNQQVLSLPTGAVLSITDRLWRLINHCNGINTIDEIAELWSKQFNLSLDERLIMMSEAFSTIKELFSAGLISFTNDKETVGHCGDSADPPNDTKT